MVTETAQILSTVHWRLGGKGPYKPTHYKHPVVLWAGESIENYRWACKFGLELAREYTHRYGRTHAVEKTLDWLEKNEPKDLENVPPTEFRLCMPIEYKQDAPDPVTAYRRLYVEVKARFCRWTKRAIPQWYLLGRKCFENTKDSKV